MVWFGVTLIRWPAWFAWTKIIKTLYLNHWSMVEVFVDIFEIPLWPFVMIWTMCISCSWQVVYTIELRSSSLENVRHLNALSLSLSPIFLCVVNFDFMNIDYNVQAFNTEDGMRTILRLAVSFLLMLLLLTCICIVGR